MITWRIRSADSNRCRIEIDLPWEIAEAIANAAPELLADLKTYTDRHRLGEEAAQREARSSEERAKEKRREHARIGARAALLLRREARKFNQRSSQAKANAEKAIAADMSVSLSLVRLCLVLHQRRLRARIKRARLAKTTAMLLEGRTNREIAAALNVSVGTVGHYVQQVRASWAEENSADRAGGAP